MTVGAERTTIPGLPPEEFQRQLAASIEAETNELILAAYVEGLARPISPELRERLEALRTGQPPEAQQTTTS